MQTKASSHRGLRWAFGAVLLVNAVTAWFPFVLDPPRRVPNTALRAADGSWSFGPLSLVTAEAPELLQRMRERGRLQVSVTATPRDRAQAGPARIFAIGRNPYDPGFLIGLDGTELVVRLPCGEGAADRDAEWRLPAPETGALAVAVDFDASSGSGPAVRIDDAAPVRLPNVCPNGAVPRTPEPTAPLSLGNDASGHRPFVGRIDSLTASAGTEVVDLLAAVPWQAPESYRLWPERLYEPPSLANRIANVWHVAAFLPLGYLAAIMTRLGAVSILGAAACFGALLTLGKVLMAGRHPDAVDVLFNTGGAALGVLAAHSIKRRAKDVESRRAMDGAD